MNKLLKQGLCVALTTCFSWSCMSSSALAQTSNPTSGSPLTTPAAPIANPLSHMLQKGAQLKEVRPDVVQEFKKYAEMPKTATQTNKVDKLNKSAENLFNHGRAQEALIRWQDAYGLSIEMKYSEGQGVALIGMCRVYLNQGKWVKARHLGENAVEILSAINDQVNLGRARVALAQAYFGLDNPVWAGKQLDAALKILVAQADEDPLQASQALSLAGTLLLRHNKMIEAIRFFQQSCSYMEKGGNKDQALVMRTKIASLMSELGWYVASYEEAAKAVKLAKRIEDPRAKLLALSSLANSQYILGEFQEARDSYKAAFSIAKSLPKGKPLKKEGRANLMMGYAFTLAAIGDTQRATKLFQQVLPFFEKKGKYYPQAETLNALGVLASNRGDNFKALPLFARAMDVQAMLKPVRPKMQLMLYRNMAATEYRIGKYREAYGHLKTALEILKQKPKRFGLMRARTYASLAEVAIRMADPDKAQQYISKAITLGEKYSDDASLWRSYTLQARFDLADKDVNKARESLKTALSHFRSPQAGYFPSPEFLRYPSTRRDMGLQLISLIASQRMAEQALLVAEQLKEERFINTWDRRSVAVKPEDNDVYLDLMRQRAHLHAAEMSTTPNSLTEQWTSWLKRFSTLARQNRSLALFIAPYPTEVGEILKTIRKRNVTTVEYLVGKDNSVAFTVDPVGRISATVLPVGKAALEQQVKTVLAPGTEPRTTKRVLKALHEQLLPQSVRNFLPIGADKQIVIIPDGVLFNLPFSALVDGNEKYLVEKHLLTLAPSMRSLVDTPTGVSGQVGVLMASNGEPNEVRETSQISSVMQPEPVSTLSANQVNLQILEQKAQGKSVLHLATPLPLLDEDPLGDPIPFSDRKGQQKATAGHLFGLKIPSDLVVLSGTSVSGKKLEGQAVQVFSRGLSYAGAKNVMMSLWNAPNNARISELVSFYKNKKQGLNDAQSLRKAQLLSMSRDPSPRSWASFQLLGLGM